MARRITATNEDINKAIQYTFSSEEESAKSEKDEIELLNINVDDSKVDLDLYKKLISKFFACIRYQFYSRLKKYWQQNKDTILPEFEKRLKEEKAMQGVDESVMDVNQYNPIQEEQVLEVAQQIDMSELKKGVVELFNVDYSWTPDIELFFTKMEFLFQQKQPVNEDFIDYIECLTAAQNEMLELIYDPRNKFIAMEENPMDSKDLMHGVPKEFKNIFDEITHNFHAADD